MLVLVVFLLRSIVPSTYPRSDSVESGGERARAREREGERCIEKERAREGEKERENARARERDGPLSIELCVERTRRI